MQWRKFIQFALVLAAMFIHGCRTHDERINSERFEIFSDGYGAVSDQGFYIPMVPIKRVNKIYHRQIVRYNSVHRRGTIVINTKQRFLYFILSGSKAVRYGIGVGRAGFSWEGKAYIAWKRKWPVWTPPQAMIKREPSLKTYAKKGMKPGLDNPLGARALYLFDSKTKEDTLFRIHGTPQWLSIGTPASSGCIRLMNQDIIDLYERVTFGSRTEVFVIQ